ncbi:hypothetical protein AC1031_008021 [Aphanomyces cochlioides]|nr:hypothetical protein AC1031_008021 [Aphanomyces cochlioides]
MDTPGSCFCPTSKDKLVCGDNVVALDTLARLSVRLVRCAPSKTSANTPSPSSNPTTSTPKPSTSSPSTPSPPSSGVGKLPTNFTWTSTGPLVSAKNDGRNIRGVKDPTIVQIGDTYHVFGSVVSEAVSYNMVYFSFKDFAQANQATFYYLVNTPIGPGYRAAPEVFYFEPQKLWYLVFQNSNVAYSTNKDITNPNGWTGNGGWVDMFVICDSVNCYLFSSDDNGHLYRAQTSISNLPNGMSQPVIAMQATDIYSLFEASAVYKAGNQYTVLVDCRSHWVGRAALLPLVDFQ